MGRALIRRSTVAVAGTVALALAAPAAAPATVAGVLVEPAPERLLARDAVRVALVGLSTGRVRVAVRLTGAAGGATLRSRGRIVARPTGTVVRLPLEGAARALLAGCDPLVATLRLRTTRTVRETATTLQRAGAPCATPTVVRSAPPAAVTAGTPGVATSGGLVDLPAEVVDRDLALLSATGVRWLRLALDWERVEPTPGAVDFSRFDRVVDLAAARGIRTLLVPTYAPAWARRVPSGPEPRSAAEFATFVGRAVAHFRTRGVRDWEIWNEPNLPRFWGPRVSPRRYGSLLRPSAAIVRAVDPGARILSGGLARTVDSSGGLTALRFLRGVLRSGGLGDVDAVAVHPYTYPLRASVPTTDRRNAWPDLGLRPDSVRAQLRAAGRGRLPIWVTEFGAPTGGVDGVTEQEQAAILADGYALARRSRRLGPVFWYANRDLSPIPGDRERSFGLFRFDFTAKPAVAAFAAAVRRETPAP